MLQVKVTHAEKQGVGREDTGLKEVIKQKQDRIKRWERLLRVWEAIRTWIAWGSKLEEGSWYDESGSGKTSLAASETRLEGRKIRGRETSQEALRNLGKAPGSCGTKREGEKVTVRNKAETWDLREDAMGRYDLRALILKMKNNGSTGIKWGDMGKEPHFERERQ